MAKSGLTSVALDDKYRANEGRALLSGTQALVRLLLTQHQRDVAAGFNTAGFVTGYRGSPLGGLDMQIERAGKMLADAGVRFQPGVNEDLAATAVWGTQQAPLLPGSRYDGVFAMWYGKGPGVDRAGDAIKHGNRFGTTARGGVLLVFGDDHPGKSSTVAYQSDQAVAAHGIPIFYPATVQEYLDYGLYAYALSRYSGLWVGFKCVNETVETTATVDVASDRVTIELPASSDVPVGDRQARIAFDPLGDDVRLHRLRLPAAKAFVRANRLDHAVLRDEHSKLGVIAAGKTYLDVRQALSALGLDDARAQALGLAIYKPAMIWPVEPEGLCEFARGLEAVFFIEEKAAFYEIEAARVLFNIRGAERPRLFGKFDDAGRELLPADVPLDATLIALALGERMVALGLADDALRERIHELRHAAANALPAAVVKRLPYFCSGCPHNTSTRIPDGSLAMSGIGCHGMVMGMSRNTLPPTQMGGEGLNWTGIAPFSSTSHVFQNLGDGTYFHSGLLAIRGAVNAGVNITYKILVNDAVAMTGGQPVEGHLSVGEITRQLAAERVKRVALVSDAPEAYRKASDLAPGVTVHHRDELDRVQRELREIHGVTAIVYEQTCAAEKRRRRKRGRFPDPQRRMFINHRVCEGCGDCSVQSNCVSIEPLETELGRKRRIDQASCNKDYSCAKGFCPSFVTVAGGALRKPERQLIPADLLASLPPPAIAPIDDSYNVLITGIGGTGVVTIGAVLGMAAHLEGKHATVFDMTGLAQKGGAVLSHLRIATQAETLAAPRIGFREADLIVGADLIVTAGADVLQTVASGRTVAAINKHLVPTAAFQLNPDIDFQAQRLLEAIGQAVGEARYGTIDAAETAAKILGDAIGANMLLVGYALQRGWLPLSIEAIERAIQLNGAAVELNLRALAVGRIAAALPDRFDELMPSAEQPTPRTAQSVDDLVTYRREFLRAYQDDGYAQRYVDLVERVRATERNRVPGSNALTEAVARYYFKLLAYKDEYEVARLYTDGEFGRALREQFGGDYRLKLQLAPPLLSRRDPNTGRPRKREFGPWIFTAMRLLARGKVLRGTALDPFGYTRERKRERALIRQYESDIETLLRTLHPDNFQHALELASLPERIRGFGPIKEAAMDAAAERRAQLLTEHPATEGAAAA